jgi:hypothetical protein
MEIMLGAFQLKSFGLLAAPPTPENGVLLNKVCHNLLLMKPRD